MSQARKESRPPAGGAAESREWSTAYMAVAFGLGLTVGFLFGQAYGAFWERRTGPAVEAEAAEESAADEHAGHDHAEHDHSGHEHH